MESAYFNRMVLANTPRDRVSGPWFFGERASESLRCLELARKQEQLTMELELPDL